MVTLADESNGKTSEPDMDPAFPDTVSGDSRLVPASPLVKVIVLAVPDTGIKVHRILPRIAANGIVM